MSVRHSTLLGLAVALALATPAAAWAQATTPAPAPKRMTDEERLHQDWANLGRYRDENAALGAPKPGERRVVFMGNSITEGWAPLFPKLFPGKPYVGRGISGQTTPQMLVRFRQDVVALKPAVVVILAGTNDIAGNTGPSTLEMIEDNLAAMTEVAQANGIAVVLSSVLPVWDYPWKPGLQPAGKIVALNAWMKAFAASRGATYLDYHSAMADERQGMKAALAYDGVHPNEAGYRLMASLVEPAIAEALEGKQYVSTTAHRVPPERLDSLRALIRASKPAMDEAKRRGGIVDVHWLIHDWGGEYNAVEVITWSSWAAIGNPSLNVEGAYPTVYPDPVQRQKVIDAWSWVFRGVHHEDNIYIKTP